MSFENEKLEDNQPEEEILTEEEGLAPEEHDAAETEQSKDKLEEEYNKLKNDYIRLYAEMDNMKKRTLQETEKTIKFAISSFAKELLGVADDMERAIAAMSDNSESCAELLKGVELTQNELTKAFEKFGIKRFNHIGQKFDPNYERVASSRVCHT